MKADSPLSMLRLAGLAACISFRFCINNCRQEHFCFFFRGGVLISPGMRFSASRERLVRFRPRVLTPHYRFGHCSMLPPLC
jgi:hypothetical protein